MRLAAFLGAPLLVFVGALWPDLPVDQTSLFGVGMALPFVGIATYLDLSVRPWHRRNLGVLAALVFFAAAILGFYYWRAGTIVAEAKFDPGIAPFDLTVRSVPVPVTRSRHFIVTLRRGQYPVTSFRYFWVGYTPRSVRIEWPRLESFKVVFDERYVATCEWNWGGRATWTMQAPQGAQPPGDAP